MSDLETCRSTAEQLRSAIQVAQSKGADIPWLKRFPERCCNFASNLLILALADAGVSRLRRVMGTVLDDKGDDLANHVWVEVSDCVIDITADHYGQPPVIVTADSTWHSSLSDIKPFIERIDLEDGIQAAEVLRLRDLYQENLSVLRGAMGGESPTE